MKSRTQVSRGWLKASIGGMRIVTNGQSQCLPLEWLLLFNSIRSAVPSLDRAIAKQRLASGWKRTALLENAGWRP
jgi:hypothetical protein